MSLFHVLDDTFVVLKTKKGVYRQAKVYVRDNRVYAGYAGGFVRLMSGGTSHPDVLWEDLDAHARIEVRRLGPVAVTIEQGESAASRAAPALGAPRDKRPEEKQSRRQIL